MRTTSAPAAVAAVEAVDDGGVMADAIGIEHGDGQDGDAVIADAGDADAVVRVGGDDAGHPGAVAVGVSGGAAGELAGEVRMGGIHAGVEDGHERGARGIDHAERVIPADERQGPLVGVARGRWGSR